FSLYNRTNRYVSPTLILYPVTIIEISRISGERTKSSCALKIAFLDVRGFLYFIFLLFHEFQLMCVVQELFNLPPERESLQTYSPHLWLGLIAARLSDVPSD